MTSRGSKGHFAAADGHSTDRSSTARITREQYEILVESFRDDPGHIEKARIAAKVHFKTAKRAWLTGWDRPPWARAIRDVFEQEKVSARARTHKLAHEAALEKAEKAARLRDEKERARIDAIEEKAREALGVRGSMNSALMMLGNFGRFQRASHEMCEKAAAGLLADVQANRLPWQDALRVLDRLALTGKRISEMFLQSMEILRKHLGEPEKLLGVVGTPDTRVDGSAALNAMGGVDALKKAIMDVAQGVDSPEAERLIEWQVEVSSQAVH